MFNSMVSSTEPVVLQMYVRLYLTEPLNNSQAKAFYQLVKKSIGAGLLNSVQTVDSEKQERDIVMVTRKYKKYFLYSIPLKRHLLFEETKKVAEAFDSYYPTKNFLLVFSGNGVKQQKFNQSKAIDLSQPQYDYLVDQLAKTQHIEWINKMVGRGWRYGPDLSKTYKTHPLIRPWHELSEKYKQLDSKLPIKFIEMLKDHGYIVLSKEDYDRLKKS